MPHFTFTRDDIGDENLVRQIVLYRLAHDANWTQMDTVWGEHAPVAFPRTQGRDARQEFVYMSREIMHRLLVQGVIAPGCNPSNLELPHFHITRYGKQVLAASSPVPYDPSGYLEGIRHVTSRAVLLAYAEEAVRCFDAGCFTAAVFFLGVACEALVVEVHSALKTTKTPSKAPVKPKYDELMRVYRNAPNSDKAQLPETLDIQLGAAYDIIRRQRNELGHPQGNPPEMDQKQAFTFFMVFPELVRDIEAFGQYCVQKSL